MTTTLAPTSPWRLWDRRFSLLLGLFFLDVWGDALVADTLLLYLSDNVGASDTTASLILGATGFVGDLMASVRPLSTYSHHPLGDRSLASGSTSGRRPARCSRPR
jgi:hypothetical protein